MGWWQVGCITTEKLPKNEPGGCIQFSVINNFSNTYAEFMKKHEICISVTRFIWQEFEVKIEGRKAERHDLAKVHSLIFCIIL